MDNQQTRITAGLQYRYRLPDLRLRHHGLRRTRPVPEFRREICGLRVAGISCITNLAAGLGHAELSHDEVKETALMARSAFIGLLQSTLPRISGAEAA
jgi:hypothetical protein